MQRVLRLLDGDPVTYTDGAGTRGEGVWEGGAVTRGPERAEPRPRRIVMAVAPPANRDRARFVVEKLSELGVESLVWLQTRHGQMRVPPVRRQMAWAVSALEQSRGSWLMGVSDSVVGWPDLEGPVAVCVPGGASIGAASGARTIAVGPEGGFDPDEIPEGAIRVDLGPTILRVETAAVVAAWNFG